MNIKDDHLYHGAALTQIAEHERFTLGLAKGGKFRVSIPEPGTRNSYLGKQLLIERKDFPTALFV
jgi:hypothetical protein